MSTDFDLDSYFKRIGFAGPADSNLKTLKALHALHVDAIPFENIDPLLGRPVHLSLEKLQQKLIKGNRGGYCFEQNTLFAAALSSIGLEVTMLAARVRWMAPPERPDGPRSHMLLRVDLNDGAYLADVGFGGHLFATPIRLTPGEEQKTPASMLRLVENDAGLTLQNLFPNEWQDVYRFTLTPELAADFEIANWFMSSNPTSLFRNNLLAERLTSDARYSLFNKRLITRTEKGSDERMINGPEELSEVLESVFGITSGCDPAEIWSRVPDAAR